MICIGFVFYAFLNVSDVVLGQPLTLPVGIPTISSATANAFITFDTTKSIFTYGYSLSNASTSKGDIISFSVDISTTSGATLSSDNLINSATGFAANSSGLILSQAGASMVPVGFLSQPRGWASGLSIRLRAHWYGPLSPGAPILPGQTLTGFILTSHGLPGVRSFIVEPHYDVDDFIQQGIDDPGLTDAQRRQIVALDQAIQQAIKFQGITIGPVQPPSITDSGKLLEFLISLKHQAASLGWISGPDSDGIVNSLDAKLSAAQDSASRGQNNAAANQLNAFINELDAQHGKAINDNAYFLLKANAQFIISKLGP